MTGVQTCALPISDNNEKNDKGIKSDKIETNTVDEADLDIPPIFRNMNPRR